MKQAGPDEEEKINLGAGSGSNVADAKRAAAGGGSDGAPPVPLMLTVQKVSMARLAQLLQLFARGGHIADGTNLKGFYDGTLKMESGETPNGPLQEQLGLRLETRKIPVQMFIVESAEKPAAN
jgi:uncharacterized protein (TIGR03435 family)